MSEGRINGPHQGQGVLYRGAAAGDARGAMILVHGRGADAHDLLPLARLFGEATLRYAALQAAGNTWYPHSFLAPIEANEPGISSGIQAIADVVAALEGEGIAAERILLLGFSQGACLSLEFAARHPRRYGGVAGLSGGLIEPQGTPRNYAGSLEGTPVFLGCSNVDPHIPEERVGETADVLSHMGGLVDKRIYPGMGHTIIDDEIAAVRTMVDGMTG